MMKINYILFFPLLLLQTACSDESAYYYIKGGTMVEEGDTVTWNVIAHHNGYSLSIGVVSNKNIFITSEGVDNFPEGSIVAHPSNMTLDFKSLDERKSNQPNLVVSTPVSFSKYRKGIVFCDLSLEDDFNTLIAQKWVFKRFQMIIHPNSLLTYNGKPLTKDTIMVEGTRKGHLDFKLSSDLEITRKEYVKICGD